jgi:hydrogenase nickel incorporation protein HypB
MITETQVRDMINTGAASLNRNLLAEYGVVAINLAGQQACGKTSLIEATLHRLKSDFRIGVIVGNIRADRDVELLKKSCDHVATLEAIDITAALVRESLEAMDLSRLDVLLIERSSSSAVAGRGYDDVGQNLNVGMLSLCGGGQKAAENLHRFKNLDLVLLSKIDLFPTTQFELEAFQKEVRRTGTCAPVIEISVITGQGMDQWCKWLQSHVHHCIHSSCEKRLAAPEYFSG